MASELDHDMEQLFPTIEQVVKDALKPWAEREVSKLVTVRSVGELDRAVIRSISEHPVVGSKGQEYDETVFEAKVLELKEVTWRANLTSEDRRALQGKEDGPSKTVRDRIAGWARKARRRQLTEVVELVGQSAEARPCDMSLEHIMGELKAEQGPWRLLLPTGTTHLTKDLKDWLGADGWIVVEHGPWWAQDHEGLAYSRDPDALVRLQAFDLTLSWDRGWRPTIAELRLRERYAFLQGAVPGAIALTKP